MLSIGDFESAEGWKFHTGAEFPGAKGAFAIAGGGRAGGKAARIDADFTAGGVYVSIGRGLKVDREPDGSFFLTTIR